MMPRLTMLENSFLATLSLSGGNLRAFANKEGPWVVMKCSSMFGRMLVKLGGCD